MYAAYKLITVNWSMFILNLVWRWLAHIIGTTTIFLAFMMRLMMLIVVALYYILLTIRRGWSCCGRYCVFIIESLIIIPLKEAIFSLIDALRIKAFLWNMFREYHFVFLYYLCIKLHYLKKCKNGCLDIQERRLIIIWEIRITIRNFKRQIWFQYWTLWYSLTAFGDDRIDWGDNGIGVHNFFMLFISSFIDGLGTNDEQLFSSFWQAAIYCMFILSCFMLGTLTTKYIQIRI